MAGGVVYDRIMSPIPPLPTDRMTRDIRAVAAACDVDDQWLWAELEAGRLPALRAPGRRGDSELFVDPVAIAEALAKRARRPDPARAFWTRLDDVEHAIARAPAPLPAEAQSTIQRERTGVTRALAVGDIGAAEYFLSRFERVARDAIAEPESSDHG